MAYYADVPAEQVEELRRFRAAYPPQTLTIAGTPWTYHQGGSGTPLLWLVGGLKMADAAYRSIPLLADAFQILAPNYPALTTMAELADGLAALLDHVGLARAHVLAGSFGGMLAQVFMRRHPARLDKLILSTTSAPDAAAAERYMQQAALAQAADEAMLRAFAPAQMFNTIAPPEQEAAFWRAYLQELYTERLDKRAITSTYDCLIDYLRGTPYQPDDFAAWGERILIIDSDDDATFGTATQTALRALYPAARQHTFRGAGHSPGSTQRDAYFALVRAFLAGAPGS